MTQVFYYNRPRSVDKLDIFHLCTSNLFQPSTANVQVKNYSHICNEMTTQLRVNLYDLNHALGFTQCTLHNHIANFKMHDAH